VSGWVFSQLTGQLADKPTRGHAGQSSRGLNNLQTGQLADRKFFKILELLYFICILNLTLTITPQWISSHGCAVCTLYCWTQTLSNIGSV